MQQIRANLRANFSTPELAITRIRTLVGRLTAETGAGMLAGYLAMRAMSPTPLPLNERGEDGWPAIANAFFDDCVALTSQHVTAQAFIAAVGMEGVHGMVSWRGASSKILGLLLTAVAATAGFTRFYCPPDWSQARGHDRHGIDHEWADIVNYVDGVEAWLPDEEHFRLNAVFAAAGGAAIAGVVCKLVPLILKKLSPCHAPPVVPQRNPEPVVEEQLRVELADLAADVQPRLLPSHTLQAWMTHTQETVAREREAYDAARARAVAEPESKEEAPQHGMAAAGAVAFVDMESGPAESGPGGGEPGGAVDLGTFRI